ncbi:MAG: putative alpha-1,2-mannosidase [Cyclobacteriaceae bacterium]|jgi:predicted alpha-1,2-mannosidase
MGLFQNSCTANLELLIFALFFWPNIGATQTTYMNKLYSKFVILGIVISFFSSCDQPVKNSDGDSFKPAEFVDPFIGTGFHGHTFPGPSMPFGMVQLSPDTHLNGWDASSGYHYDDDTIFGFSHTHLSGTGIGDYGDILLLPFTGETSPSPAATFKKSTEEASPGYYQVHLDNFDVQAELTTTYRVGMHRYTFPKGKDKKVMVDVGHILQQAWGHRNVMNEIEFVDSKTIRGTKISKGWAFDHRIYFYIEFSSPYKVEATISDSQSAEGIKVSGTDVRSYLNFGQGESEVLMKVSISAVSVEGAEKNLKAEAPDWGFDQVRAAAESTWNKELSKIKVESKDKNLMINFYTALYHSMMAPQLYQDVDGQYRGMDLEVHKAEEFNNYTVFSLWDTFRAFHPLMSIIDEKRTTDWVNGLLKKYEQGGLLPKWPLAGNYTGTMVGYPAVAVIADVMSKGYDGIDYGKAFDGAMASSQYNPQLIQTNGNPRAGRLMTKHTYYLNKIGLVPADSTSQSVSYGLEFAYYDWCIAQIAKKQGEDNAYKTYMDRSTLYKKYYDPEVGFMRGKLLDGSWNTPFSPYFSEHMKSDFTEGNAWQWSWFVPHDVQGLVELMGGKEGFTSKLDSLFTADTRLEGKSASGDITGLIGQYAHGNEPSHHIAHLYNYVGQPWKTQELTDQIMKTMYKPQPDGLRGNEDCGQMSAWYVMNAMGFYQVCPGDPVYSIGRPMFDKVSIGLAGGGVFTIEVENNAMDNKYIEFIELNGVKLDTPFFNHSDIKDGAVLKVEMRGAPFKN